MKNKYYIRDDRDVIRVHYQEAWFNPCKQEMIPASWTAYYSDSTEDTPANISIECSGKSRAVAVKLMKEELQKMGFRVENMKTRTR